MDKSYAMVNYGLWAWREFQIFINILWKISEI